MCGYLRGRSLLNLGVIGRVVQKYWAKVQVKKVGEKIPIYPARPTDGIININSVTYFKCLDKRYLTFLCFQEGGRFQFMFFQNRDTYEIQTIFSIFFFWKRLRYRKNIQYRWCHLACVVQRENFTIYTHLKAPFRKISNFFTGFFIRCY